jgi:hypothetical protein
MSARAGNLETQARASETVVRIYKRDNPYVQIDRRTVQDKRLSWEARGMLAYLLSLPPDWRITVEHLQKQGDAGRDAVRRILRELQTFGYASGFGKPDDHNQTGRFGGSVITVFETPDLNPRATTDAPAQAAPMLLRYPTPTPEKPSSVQPTPEKPSPEMASPYIEENSQKKQGTKEKHTHRARQRATSSADAGVCVTLPQNSRHSLEVRKAHALRNGLGGGWLTRSKSGEFDESIDLDLERLDPAKVEERRTTPKAARTSLGSARDRLRSISRGPGPHDFDAEIGRMDLEPGVREQLLGEFCASEPRNGGANAATAATT